MYRIVHDKITSGVLTIANQNGKNATRIANLLTCNDSDEMKLQKLYPLIQELQQNIVNDDNLLDKMGITAIDINSVGMDYINSQLTVNLKFALFIHNQTLQITSDILESIITDNIKIYNIGLLYL
jgi:hypothetical protein